MAGDEFPGAFSVTSTMGMWLNHQTALFLFGGEKAAGLEGGTEARHCIGAFSTPGVKEKSRLFVLSLPGLSTR